MITYILFLIGIWTSGCCWWNGRSCYVWTSSCWSWQSYWGNYSVGGRFCDYSGLVLLRTLFSPSLSQAINLTLELGYGNQELPNYHGPIRENPRSMKGTLRKVELVRWGTQYCACCCRYCIRSVHEFNSGSMRTRHEDQEGTPKKKMWIVRRGLGRPLLMIHS